MLHLGGSLASALRAARRRPGSVALTALTAALAVGVATTGAELVDRVLLRPLDYPEAGDLVMVWSSIAGMPRAPLSGPELRDLRERVPALAQAGGVWTTQAALLEGGRPEPIRVALLTGNLLELLGARPAVGRLLEDSDGGRGGDPVLVLGGGLWQRRFGGDPSVLGRSLRLDGGWGFPGGRFTAVGALPADFRLALPAEAGLVAEPDVWIAWPDEVLDGDRALYYLRVVARRAPGTPSLELDRQLVRLDAQLVAEHAEYEGEPRRLFARPLPAEVTRSVRPAVTTLLAGAVLLLAIALVDASGLALARAVERRRELATRAALGASRSRLVALLLGESALPALAGGLLGTLLATEAVGVFRAVAPAGLFTGGSGPGVPALATAAVVTLATAGASAAAALAGAFSPGSGWPLHGRSEVSPAGGGWRRVLVVGQTGLAAALLVGAALAARTFASLLGVDPGFRPEDALAFRIELPPARYPGPREVAGFERELEERLQGLPGVEAVGATSHLPFDTLPNWTSGCRWVGDPRPHVSVEADARAVSGGYREAVGLGLRRGRFLDDGDVSDGEIVVVVDERLAATAPAGVDPLGASVEVSLWRGRSQGFRTLRARVVGIVGHARHSDLTRDLRPQLYAALPQSGRNQLGVVLRTAADPVALSAAVRSELAALDADLALAGPRRLEGYLDTARAPARGAALIAGGFALASLLLALAGVHGVLAHVVSRRRREIGLRLALGAAPAGVRSLVLGEGMRLSAAGLGLGLVAAGVAARLARGLLFGVSPADPVSFAGVAALVAAAALAACWLPAARAAATDPMRALREE